MKDAIKQSWLDYCADTPSFFIDPIKSLEFGWKDGYEYILTELLIDNKISREIFNDYIKKLR